MEKELRRMQYFGLSPDSCGRFQAIGHPLGSCGATMSHMGVLKQSMDRGDEFLIVLEDDFTMRGRADNLSSRLVSQTPPSSRVANSHSYSNPRFLQVNFLCEKKNEFDVGLFTTQESSLLFINDAHNENVARVISSNNAAGYIITRDYMPRLYKCFEQSLPLLLKTGRHWLHALDQAWKALQKTGRWYVFRPVLGRQRVGDRSDTGYKRDRTS
jgi:GR25 family glycosyltransferase involved in LPS biosynthesis